MLHLLLLKKEFNQVETHLDMVEVLGLGDGGGEPAVAEGADHQLSVYTDHKTELTVRNLQCVCVCCSINLD